jgi:hypothetical protein
MAIGVEPASRLLTNTRAPAGRDCTLSSPTVALASPTALAGAPGTILFVGLAAARRFTVVEVVGRCAVNCSVRSSAAYPARATRMVYDPSAKSRSASGVFPRGFPFTSTSASAGVERISTLPICVRRAAPDAARDGLGLGATVVLGALGLSTVALGEVGAEVDAPGAGFGRSTIVSSTPGFCSAAGVGAGDRRKNPTDSAARTAKTMNIATIGQRRIAASGSTSSGASSVRGGCVDQAGANAERGATEPAVNSGSTSSSRSRDAPRSMTRSNGSSSGAIGAIGAMGAMGALGALGAADLKVGTTTVSFVVLAFRPAAKSAARSGLSSKAGRTFGPSCASSSSRLSAESRFPVAASNAIAMSEYTSGPVDAMSPCRA